MIRRRVSCDAVFADLTFSRGDYLAGTPLIVAAVPWKGREDLLA